ncbi:MAG: hypothetical protein ACI4UO_05025 [Paludibacteraceae bacterium]
MLRMKYRATLSGDACVPGITPPPNPLPASGAGECTCVPGQHSFSAKRGRAVKRSGSVAV